MIHFNNNIQEITNRVILVLKLIN